MNELSRKIGRMVRFHRKKAGLTQKELAVLADIGKTAVFDIEKGKATVRLATLLAVLHVLNIQLGFQGPLMHYFEETGQLLSKGPGDSHDANRMKKARVFVDGILAGHLIELEKSKRYEFIYLEEYQGSSISLTMPVTKKKYDFDQFPPFFDGFLPEGFMLEALLRKTKIDADDRFEQLVRVGGELVGNITVELE